MSTGQNPHHVNHTLKTDAQAFFESLDAVVTKGDPLDKYVVLYDEVLGKGTTSKILKATVRTPAPGEPSEAVIKQMYIDQQIRKFDRIAEIKAMKENKHPNIVDYLDSYLVTENELWIVMEYLDGGSLEGVVKNYRFNIYEIATVCGEVLKGLEFLHGKKWMHRDLKSANIMLGLDGRVKLADFGFATHLTEENKRPVSEVGTARLMAPEMHKAESYTEKIDVWALGIMAIEMFTGKIPHSEIAELAAKGSILLNPPPNIDDRKDGSADFNAFLKKCLVKDYSARADVDELLKLPFITKARPTSTLRQMIQDAQNWINAPLILKPLIEEYNTEE